MKRLFSVLALVLSISIVLAACGSPAPAEPAPAAPAAPAETAPAPADGDSIHLVYWSMWNNTEPQAQVLEQGIRDFEARNPGVTVEINWAGREIRQTLSPAIDNGMQIDIFDEDTQRVNENWGNYILNLEKYYEESYPTTDGVPYKDVVMPALQSLSRSFSADGGLYTVGYQPFAFIFMYNKDHFADAGIASVPKTWEEFLDACEKLKAAGYTPLTSDNEYISGLFGYHLAKLKGPDFGTDLVNDASGALWDDPAVLEAAKAIEALAANGYFDRNAEGNIWPAGQQDIAIGTVTMYLNGTWLVNEIMGSTGPEFPWGSFNYPAVSGGVSGIEAANYGSQVFAINKDCAHPDKAFELLVHLTTGEWDAKLAQESFGVPVAGTTDWPVQLSEAKAVFESLTTLYPWVAGVESNTDVGPVVRQNVQRLAGGSITAEQFVANCKSGT
ncbi:MAG: ABC transporter substrate-binding protein [Oscillospiraceae bacterium]|nr:ABC transporter substrate-binding protein [Oscillospiraceae bacterium]